MSKIVNFSFEDTELEGLKIVRPFVAHDERGFLMKTFERILFEQHGIELDNGEDIVSFSHKGVLRGIHFQTEYPQNKLVRVVNGEVWDVAVDLRKNSPTYGKWKGFYLSGENGVSLYIPKGFGHGFLALTDNVILLYKIGEVYHPDNDSGIRWNDPRLAIEWPIDEVKQLIVSEKDGNLQSFVDFQNNVGGL